MTADTEQRASRAAHPVVGHIACLAADVALLAWTVAVWWRPSGAKVLSLHRALPWAADPCYGATLLGVAAPLAIAGAILVLALSLRASPDHRILALASVSIGACTVIAVVAPWFVSQVSSCMT
jgi:hypothetical protein